MRTISDLTKTRRDALSNDDFAVPGKRKLPIADATHLKLAWDMVDRTQGLTPEERSEARRRILERAKKMGIDTSKWSTNVHASSVQFDELEHPNKMPFSGILTWLNAPSDEAPHGSGGRRVMISASVGKSSLDSLIGMAVNYIPSLDDHSPQNKVGVITDYQLGAKDESGAIPVEIEGYIYAMDFPDVAEDVKRNQNMLGFSYETAQTVLLDGVFNGEPVAVVDDIGYFTGASILYKHKAAYKNTSLAASADDDAKEVDHLDFEKLLASFEQMIDSKLKAAGLIKDSTDPDHDGDDDSNAGGDTDGDATNGQGGEIKASDDVTGDAAADNTVADAVQSDANDDGNAAEPAQAGETVADVNPAPESAKATETPETGLQASTAGADLLAELKALKDEIASLKAAAEPQFPQRKSIAHPVTLMAKYDVKPEDDYTKLLASIDSREDISADEKWALKIEVRDKHLKTQKQ